MEAAQTQQRVPPSPPRDFIAGHLLSVRRDMLGFLERNLAYGDVVNFQMGPVDAYQLNHPDDVQFVLVRNWDKVQKSVIYKQQLREYLGDGLLVSDGDHWKRQRKLAQPAFHTQRISAYADIMVQYTQDLLDTWQDGETRDIAVDMMRVTLWIVGKTLFDADLRHDSPRVGDALETLLHTVTEDSKTIIRLPSWIPTPYRRRKAHALSDLNDITYRIIEERRKAPDDRGDLLSMLMMSQDEDGQQMDDQQLRDETVTIVLAGHETTANALTWTLYLLSQNPAVESRLYDEIQRVLGDRPPQLADLRSLPYLEKVVKEGMRLYPPAWGIGRQSLTELELGGYRVPARSNLMIIPYLLHRDERWWDDPLTFNPDRWTPEMESALPKYAYMPFGGGPRICIGNSFAKMEAELLLASIVQRYRLTLKPGHPVEPEPLVTLRPKHGMQMTLHART